MTYQYNTDEEGYTFDFMKSWIVTVIKKNGISKGQLREAAFLLNSRESVDCISDKVQAVRGANEKEAHLIEEVAKIIIDPYIYYCGTAYYQFQPRR